MTQPTQADIDRLVKAASHFSDAIKQFGKTYVIAGSPVCDELDVALRPFQPDPETKLIEEMVAAYETVEVLPKGLSTAGVRAMIAVVKERGLPE